MIAISCDIIPLPKGRLGILVAGVANKGTGAALYMALSRTLIRTYAVEHDTQPALALVTAKGRILMDTQSDPISSVARRGKGIESGTA